MTHTKCPRPTSPSQPTTGARCHCRPGVWRDNCPNCEGTGWTIDFAAIRARKLTTTDNTEAAQVTK